MKTISEIKDEIATKNGFLSWEHTFNSLQVDGWRLQSLIDEAMKEFATMAIEEQKRLCRKIAKTKWEDRDNDLNPCQPFIVVDPDSILNAPNVELK